MNKCTICESPNRTIWVIYAPKVFELVKRGNWVEIEKCPACGHLWCKVPYEPYGAFPYWVSWNYSMDDFTYLHDLDEGKTLCKWHECTITKDYLKLSDEDLEKVEAHKRRAWGGGAPVEANINECPDLNDLLKKRSKG
jgi:hypothetical protein